MIPLSLYIHFPWCIQKCPYCDFNSHALKQKQDLNEALYIEHLLSDLRYAIRDEHRPLSSIFMGGGTPSLFSGQSIHQLLNGIRQEMDFLPDIEITLEANPATWEQQRFADYLNAGVNRLSLGIQSFQAHQLSALGRVHQKEEALQAIRTAQEVGFKRLNLDLMFALPEQSVSEALDDLAQALAFQPEHLSWYQLTLEPNTVFYHQPPPLPDADTQYAIYEAGSAFLRQHHYQNYEISAWTRQQTCRHNLNYWEYGDYLGIGAGAHYKITKHQIIHRGQQFSSPSQYQKAPGKFNNPYSARIWEVRPEEQPFELMMNALRLREGIDKNKAQSRTFFNHQDIEPIIQKLKQKQLWTDDEKRYQCSESAWLHLNEVLSAFLK